MKNITFKFYSVLKNEDAMPYIGGNLLVAADGVGGSGSTVHQIDRVKHSDMRNEILSGALGDVTPISPKLMKYVEELIAPMADGKDDTSALWASRIVIARCVYALTEGEFKDAKLEDKKIRANLAEFIVKGLHSTAEKFDLKNGKYDNQLRLPTTLAFIRFKEKKRSVIAETVWAGDSRLYALTPSGLKLLSVDDEDSSGSITNLFYADNKKIHLNYLRHEIQAPCILMAVSDGIFDPFEPHDHLGVEHTLLTAISESSTQQELADKLQGFFDSVHGDDATMAFVSFGFTGFAGMKKIFEKRTGEIVSVRQRQAEMQAALEVMNLSEEDAAHYVASRTSDRFDYIIPTLIDAMGRGVDDIAITAEIKNIAKSAQEAFKSSIEKTRKERRAHALAELDKYVLAYPERTISEILTRLQINSQIKSDDPKKLFYEFKKIACDLASLLNNSGKAGGSKEEFAVKKQHLHEQIQEKITEYRKIFDDRWYDEKSASKDRERDLDILHVWDRIDNSLKFCWRLQDIGKLPLNDRELADAVQNFNSDCRNMNSQQTKIDTVKRNYEKLWKRLFEILKRNEKLVNVLLSSDAIHKFGFDESDTVTLADGKGNKDCLLGELKNKKTVVVSGIIKALATGYDKTSIIDVQYNQTRLNLFRTYYRLRNNPNDGIKEFEIELNSLEAEYTSLVDHAEF